MCEKYEARRYPVTCNKATECIGKEGGEAADKTRHQAPKCSGHMDNCNQILSDDSSLSLGIASYPNGHTLTCYPWAIENLICFAVIFQLFSFMCSAKLF